VEESVMGIGRSNREGEGRPFMKRSILAALHISGRNKARVIELQRLHLL
jgi:hypothetical protein